MTITMKYYVYILRSKVDRNRIYIGYSINLKKRLGDHSNPQPNAYTRQFAPWELETYIVFKDKNLAQQFELYLKSQSGRAFLRKRMI